MITGKPKEFNPKDIKKLRTFLEKDFSLKNHFSPVNLTKYAITMDNDYLAPSGNIIKKQHLEAVYSREIESAVSPSAADFIYTWEEVAFSQQDKKSNKALMDWTFAQQLKFRHCKTFSKDCFGKNEIEKTNRTQHNIGTWYDDLINVPAVNLLYMMTWDVIFFEEFNCTLISENMSKIGDTSLVDSLSKSYVQLSFKGCNFEHSFFKNGNVYVSFMGISLFNQKPVCVYEFRSAGRLNVEKQGGEVKQEGESFFIGKIYLDLQNGDLIFTELIELLTVSLKNNQGKIVPMQKRRLVQLQNLN